MSRGGRPCHGLDMSWQEFGNCQGVDPDLFFPERNQSTAAAKAVCAGCVVRDDCLEFALAINEEIGIWGGTSGRQRRQILRQRRTAAMAPQPQTVAA